MADAKLTLYGIEHYLNLNDDTIFTGFSTLPAGINTDLLIDNIMLQGGEFPVLYADPGFLKYHITSWCGRWRRTFEKWIAALDVQYDPLSNYDRREEWTDINAGTRSTSDQSNRSGSHQDAGSQYQTNADMSSKSIDGTSSAAADSTGDQSETDKKAAFNSSTFENDTQKLTDNSTRSLTSSATNTTESGNNNGTETATDSRTGSHNDAESRETTETNSDTGSRKGRAWGNIGVTTSQQMLEAELSIAEWNLYDHITDLFLESFTIPIYI